MNKKISEIGDRAKSIFKLLVENYIATGEPLGSKSISSQINNQLSPATIRSVLNEFGFKIDFELNFFKLVFFQ